MAVCRLVSSGTQCEVSDSVPPTRGQPRLVSPAALTKAVCTHCAPQTGANIHETREWVLRNSPVPVGTVPIYQASWLKVWIVDYGMHPAHAQLRTCCFLPVGTVPSCQASQLVFDILRCKLQSLPAANHACSCCRWAQRHVPGKLTAGLHTALRALSLQLALCPSVQALEKAGGEVEGITWELFR